MQLLFKRPRCCRDPIHTILGHFHFRTSMPWQGTVSPSLVDPNTWRLSTKNYWNTLKTVNINESSIHCQLTLKWINIEGDVDRLRRFWLTGVCKPYNEERQFSEPLSTEQFLSAFLLLLSGIGLAFLLLGLEHIYFHSIRPHLTSPTTGACCSLISIVSLLGRIIRLVKLFLHP